MHNKKWSEAEDEDDARRECYMYLLALRRSNILRVLAFMPSISLPIRFATWNVCTHNDDAMHTFLSFLCSCVL